MTQRPFIHNAEKLAEVVTTFRKQKTLTIEQLAEKSGVTVEFLVAIESAHPRAEIGKIMRVLRTLDLKPRSIPATTHWAFDNDGSLKQEFANEDGSLKQPESLSE